MQNLGGSNDSDNPRKPETSDSELWDFPKTDPVTANSLINRFIRACPAPGRDVDVEIFKAQIAAALVMVPPEVAETVMDPVKGLAVRVEFFPTPSTVRDALEKEMQPIYRARDRRRRAEEFKQAAVGTDVSQEARDRAFEAWKIQKKEMEGKKSPEVVKAEANAFLREGWRDQRWNTNVNPVKISDELRRNLEAKAKPDYVSLEIGQAQQGKRDDE